MQAQIQAPTIDRERITPMLMRLFDHWQLPTADQLSLLGFSKDNRATLTKYRKGQPIANDRDKLERAGILLGIHKSLRLLFPHHRDIVYGWMRQPNRAFGGRTPVQVVDEQGLIGLYRVRAYLDRQRGR